MSSAGPEVGVADVGQARRPRRSGPGAMQHAEVEDVEALARSPAPSSCRARSGPRRGRGARTASTMWCGQRRGLGDVEARRRLVEQQQRGLGAQGPAELDEPGQARRQVGRPLVGHVARGRAGRAISSTRSRPSVAARAAAGGAGSRRARRPRWRSARFSRDGHRAEHLEALERAAEAGPGPAVRRPPGDVGAVEVDRRPARGAACRRWRRTAWSCRRRSGR